jgi:hypothetical protein
VSSWNRRPAERPAGERGEVGGDPLGAVAGFALMGELVERERREQRVDERRVVGEAGLGEEGADVQPPGVVGAATGGRLVAACVIARSGRRWASATSCA